MKNQINISNLTPEQIDEIRQQLKAYDEQPKSIMDRVKSWEDTFELITKQGNCYINNDSSVMAFEAYRLASFHKNIIPSEKHVKSILAACQLMVIAEALNEGSNVNLIAIRPKSGNLKASITSHFGCYSQIKFKNIPTAEYAITQFEDLWYDYFMIDKPE